MENEIPIEISLDFPYKICDKLLKEKIEELSWGVVKTNNPNLADKYSSIAQIGLIEMGNRSAARNSKAQIGLIEMGNRSAARNSKFTKTATSVNILLTFIAITFSFVSVYFANKDDNADGEWQKNQLKSYNQMTIELRKLNKKIDSLTNSPKIVKKSNYK